MTSELIEPSRNKKKIFIILAMVLITAISIVLISIGIAASNPEDGGGG